MLVSSQIDQVNYTLGQDLAASTTAVKYVSDAQILVWLQESMQVICTLGKVWDAYKSAGVTLVTSTESYAEPVTATVSTVVASGASNTYSAVTEPTTGIATFTTNALLTTGTHVRVTGTVYSGDYYVIHPSGTNPYYCQMTTVRADDDYRLTYSATDTGTIVAIVTTETTAAVDCLEVLDVRMVTSGESLTKTNFTHRGKVFSSGTAPIWWFSYAGKIWFVPIPTAVENGLTADVFFLARPTGTLISTYSSGTQIDGTDAHPIPFPDKWHHLMPLWASIKGKMVYRLYDEANVLLQSFSQQLGVSVEELKSNLGMSAE